MKQSPHKPRKFRRINVKRAKEFRKELEKAYGNFEPTKEQSLDKFINKKEYKPLKELFFPNETKKAIVKGHTS